MLTTRDIERYLRKVKWFGGVYPVDRIPMHLTPPKSLIINLDPSYKEGSHWVSVHFDRLGRAFYFDSFGREPSGNILTMIEKNAPRGYNYSSVKYQGNLSSACGYFCILFVLLANKREMFFRLFSKCKHEKNERKLMSVLKSFIDDY